MKRIPPKYVTRPEREGSLNKTLSLNRGGYHVVCFIYLFKPLVNVQISIIHCIVTLENGGLVAPPSESDGSILELIIKVCIPNPAIVQDSGRSVQTFGCCCCN